MKLKKFFSWYYFHGGEISSFTSEYCTVSYWTRRKLYNEMWTFLRWLLVLLCCLYVIRSCFSRFTTWEVKGSKARFCLLQLEVDCCSSIGNCCKLLTVRSVFSRLTWVYIRLCVRTIAVMQVTVLFTPAPLSSHITLLNFREHGVYLWKDQGLLRRYGFLPLLWDFQPGKTVFQKHVCAHVKTLQLPEPCLWVDISIR